MSLFFDDNTDTMAPIGSRANLHASDQGLLLLYADVAEVAAVCRVSATPTFIGRQPPAGGLTLAHKSVSRVHVELVAREGGVQLKDLGSRNGTFVNGQRVEQALLRHGDIVRIGDCLFKTLERDAAKYTAFRAGAVVEPLPGLVGSVQLEQVAREVRSIARSDVPVVVQGETGVGKEAVARALHTESTRSGPFRAINCAAIPAQLVESELFGHRQGAFTGATRSALGLFRATDQGTLLLDEVGDMPLEAQAKLLRVLETKEVVAVGEHEAHRVDVRVVAATHRNLPELVKSGAFRADLYARLSGYTVHVSPLRERIEDVPALAAAFLAQQKRAPPTFAALYAMVLYDWPFNVRELRSALFRPLVGEPAALDLPQLPQPLREHFARVTSEAAGRQPEAPTSPQRGQPTTHHPRPAADDLRQLIERAAGNIAAVARVLNRDRALVHRWLRDAGIDPEQYRR